MSGATRDSSETWVADAADLLIGDLDVASLDLTPLDGNRPAMPNVELGVLCDIIFAKGSGPVFPGFDLFEPGARH